MSWGHSSMRDHATTLMRDERTGFCDGMRMPRLVTLLLPDQMGNKMEEKGLKKKRVKHTGR